MVLTPDEARMRIRELEAALRELVACKDQKTADGKTPDYVARQAMAWRRARAALAEEGGRCNT